MTKRRMTKSWALLALSLVLVLAACNQPDPVARIELAPTTMELEIGDAEAFTATVYSRSGSVLTPNIVWSSSTETVATVDDGTVTALAEGETTITAEVGNISAEATVTVSASETVIPDPDPDPDPDTVTIEPSTSEVALIRTQTADVSVDVEASGELKADVTWSTSDDSIASVNADGTAATITAEGTGTATITVQSVADPDSGATIDVEVTAMNIALAADAEEQYVGLPVNLTAVLDNSFDGADEGISWSVNDDDLAEINPDADSGATATLSALSAGTVTVTATSNQDLLVTDSVTLIINPEPALDPTRVYVGTEASIPSAELGTEVNPFPTINAALADSRVNNDATIHVAAGTYSEQLVMSTDFNIEGVGADDVTITAPDTMTAGTGGAYSIVETLGSGTEASISGVTIDATFATACDSTYGFGITVIDGASLDLKDAAIINVGSATSNYCSRALGLNLGEVPGYESVGTGSAILSNVEITLAASGKLGIDIGPDSNLEADMLSITAETTDTGNPAQNGIILDNGSATITQAEITGFNYIPDSWNAVGLIYYGGNLHISDSSFNENKAGLVFQQGSGEISLDNNSFSDNRWALINYLTNLEIDFSGNSINGITADPSTPIADLFQLERAVFHKLDDVDNGNVIFVPNNHYAATTTNITNAVAIAEPGDTVHVAAGRFDTEQLSLTNSIVLLGPNAGVMPDGQRGEEAVLTGNIVIGSDDVTVSGLKFQSTGRAIGTAATQGSWSNLHISHNLFERPSTADRAFIPGMNSAGTFYGNTVTGPGSVGVTVDGNALFTVEANHFDTSSLSITTEPGVLSSAINNSFVEAPIELGRFARPNISGNSLATGIDGYQDLDAAFKALVDQYCQDNTISGSAPGVILRISGQDARTWRIVQDTEQFVNDPDWVVDQPCS